MISKRKRIAFCAIPSLVLALLVFACWWYFFPKRGSALSRDAWERTYSERRLPIPVMGPRDGGFRGERLFPKPRHPATGWCEPPNAIPGILEIDQAGVQRLNSAGPARFTILFLGGSVAMGTYASTTEKTYFGRLASMLAADGKPAAVTVFAAGAWKAAQDAAALEHMLQSGLKPDLIVFVNGLNDLTNGARADTLFGQPVATKDGSDWTKLYHAHDYKERVDAYLRIMQAVITIASEHDASVLLALQPALFERQPLSTVERQLLWASLAPHESQQALVDSYSAMRTGLARLADNQRVFFVDCSKLFEGERPTTFTDMWHFSDFGHEKLAEELAPQIRQALELRVP